MTEEEQAMVIRIHNKKLMKFILGILFIDIIIILIGWYYDNTNLANLGSGIGLTCGLIGLWIMNHHPKYCWEKSKKNPDGVV